MTDATDTPTATIPEQAAAPARELDHGGRIIAALETAWAAIRDRHPDVPRAVLITGNQNQHGGARLGHFVERQWATREGSTRAHEMFIAGELIAQGAREVLAVMIHEAAHGVATTRGIKDCSGDALRYHNKKFVELAEEMGMQGPRESVPTHGWAFCTLPDTTAAAYAEVIEALDAAALPYRGYAPRPTEQDEAGDSAQDEGGAEQEEEKDKRNGKRFKVVCQCKKPRSMQVTPAMYEAGPVICGLCGAAFAPVGEEPEPVFCGQCGADFVPVAPQETDPQTDS
ncbi:hypothetical protein QMK19_29030 [Streptomyces sp. H10-C2]|uniref:hypothetical protein n=1 Tax=Streptomyces TaxID=1883 RepID=UPI0018E05C83|nr:MULTISPECIES: hypothetical protein [Streptomyces]MDJ0344255.1 hypothetical protein [Streptomyces sp. PH10-H1]MDJ0373593.1 hypothetical protein [Streptomyces sp. H10-C2]